MITAIKQHRFAVCRDKKYLDKDWQKGNTYDYCMSQIKSGRANGYGIISGEFDGLGIVIIDFDGESSSIVANAIGQWLTEIDSMAWTSGKKGHYQIAFVIPKPHLQFWQGITKHDLTNHKGYNCINGHHLEIRYNNCASVLPESVHPETGYYKWIKEIAPRELSYAESYDLLNVCTALAPSDLSSDQELNLIIEALSYISPDDYHMWTRMGSALYRHGVDISVWDNWSQQSAKYKANEISSKWQSFDKITNVNIGSLYFEAKKNGFDQSQWMRQNLKSNRVALSKTLQRSKDDIPEQDNTALINQFLDKYSALDYTASQLSDAIAVFCSQNRIAERLVRNAIQDRKADNYKQEELSNFLNLDTIINTPNKRLDLPFLLGDDLGQLFIFQAKAIPTNPDALFSLFLPAIASLIGTKQLIVANYGTNFIVPYILRTAIVADSGSAKSAVLKNATWGVEMINKRNMKRYFSELKEWELTPEKERGDKPKRDKIIFKDFNFEGLYKALEENGHGSGLVIRDELKGYFNMVISNRTGQGDNVQKDLELFEGGEIDKLRMSDDCTYNISKSAVSMTGCLQWSTLESIFNDKADDSGVSPRWNFCCSHLPEYKLMDRTVNTQFTDAMVNLANHFKSAILPEVLEVSDEAYAYLQDWFNNDMRVGRVKADYLQEKSKHNKILSDCIKFAGILHNLHIALNTGIVEDVSVIGVEMMMLACYVAEFYLAQYLYAFSKCQGDMLNSQLLRILEIVEKKGECTASQIRSALGGSNCSISAQKIGELMLDLVTLGKVQRVPTKQGVRVRV